MNRIKTGINGLDELLEGGYPEGSTILVSGGPGTGKTIFCTQFLYNGAKFDNEPGIFVTLEEGQHNLWWNSQRFKWELPVLEKRGMIYIHKFEPEDVASDLEKQVKKIIEKAKQSKARRLVIDSLTAFAVWNNDKAKIRYAVYLLAEELRKIQCTALLACETSGRKNEFSSFGVEEYLADGIITLHFVPPRHFLSIRKMRGTAIEPSVHPLNFTESGLTVNSKDKMTWEELKE